VKEMDENTGHVLVILMALVFTFGITVLYAKIKKNKK